MKNNNKGKLIIEREDFESPEWNITVDLTGVMSGATAGSKDFNDSLISRFNAERDNIVESCGADAWNELAPVLTKLASSSKLENDDLYDDVYDLCDKHGIKLKQASDEAPAGV